MATGRRVVTPVLATQHRTAMDQMTTATQLPTLGVDPAWGILSSHIYMAWGKYQAHILEIWHKDTLQGEQYPQTDTGQAQR